MSPVFTLIERGGPERCPLIGLYEDRQHAISVATSHANYRLQQYRDADRRILGIVTTTPAYEISCLDAGSIVQLTIWHRPSNELGAMSWIVEAREIIAAPLLEQPELAGLFAHAGGAS